MKINLKAVLFLGTAVASLHGPALMAGDGIPGDAVSNWRTPASAGEGLHLSAAMNFGGSAAQPRSFDFKLRYGDSLPQAGRWNAPALFDARHTSGQWQSLKLSGVDVLQLQRRMQAEGEDSNTTGWIIGGLVGVGAIAIIARQVGNDGQESFDINRGLGANN